MDYDLHKKLLLVSLQALATLIASYTQIFGTPEYFGKYKLSTRWHMIGVSGIVSIPCTVVLLLYVVDLYVVCFIGMYLPFIYSVVTLHTYLIFIKNSIKNNKTNDIKEEITDTREED